MSNAIRISSRVIQCRNARITVILGVTLVATAAIVSWFTLRK